MRNIEKLMVQFKSGQLIGFRYTDGYSIRLYCRDCSEKNAWYECDNLDWYKNYKNGWSVKTAFNRFSFNGMRPDWGEGGKGDYTKEFNYCCNWEPVNESDALEELLKCCKQEELGNISLRISSMSNKEFLDEFFGDRNIKNN